MKLYEVTFNQESKGVYKVSLVKDPAVQSTLMYFYENEKPMFFANDEKRVIYSIAMRPNKKIFRKEIYNEPAEVFFSEETIEGLQQNYFRQNGNLSTNINHENFDTHGVFPFESWIVNNPISDKSTTIGLETQKGDWVMGFKIDNQEVWEQCKNGNLDGLSIEGNLMYTEVQNNTNTNINMTTEEKKENFFTHMMKFFATDEPVKEEDKPIDEEMAVDPLAPVEAVEAEAPSVEVAEVNLEAENEQLKARISELEAQVATSEADKVKAETSLTQMKSETPATKAVVDMPVRAVAKNYSEMNNYEKAKFNREK